MIDESSLGTGKISGGPLRPFRQAVSKPKKIGPEVNPWFWNPNNPTVVFGPDDFRKRLKREMGSELEVTWTPIQERWLVWARTPRIQNPICQGWRLLFIHQGPSGEHLQLDERVFARLYHASAMKHGSAKQYFDRLVAEMERDKAKRAEKYRQDTIDAAMPSFDHAQIQVSGFGKSSGSKFSTYHS